MYPMSSFFGFLNLGKRDSMWKSKDGLWTLQQGSGKSDFVWANQIGRNNTLKMLCVAVLFALKPSCPALESVDASMKPVSNTPVNTRYSRSSTLHQRTGNGFIENSVSTIDRFSNPPDHLPKPGRSEFSGDRCCAGLQLGRASLVLQPWQWQKPQQHNKNLWFNDKIALVVLIQNQNKEGIHLILEHHTIVHMQAIIEPNPRNILLSEQVQMTTWLLV